MAATHSLVYLFISLKPHTDTCPLPSAALIICCTSERSFTRYPDLTFCWTTTHYSRTLCNCWVLLNIRKLVTLWTIQQNLTQLNVDDDIIPTNTVTRNLNYKTVIYNNKSCFQIWYQIYKPGGVKSAKFLQIVITEHNLEVKYVSHEFVVPSEMFVFRTFVR